MRDKTPDNAAGFRVGVRGAVALEVLIDDETIGTRADVSRLLVEDVVRVEADLLGGSGVVGYEVVLEPLQYRTRRDLAGFNGVLTRHDAVRVGAEESLAVNFGVGLTSQHMRGTGDEGHRPCRQHAQTNLASPCISQSLCDRDSWTQAE